MSWVTGISSLTGPSSSLLNMKGLLVIDESLESPARSQPAV